MGNQLSAQVLIGSPNSLVLVYNIPGNSFYLCLKGQEKQLTDQENIYLLDRRLIQVKTLHKSKFLRDGASEPTFHDFIQTYIRWESDYLEQTLHLNIHSRVDWVRDANGKELVVWSYDMPIDQTEVKSDSTVTTPTRKQLFVLGRSKDYLVGLNSPVFEPEKIDSLRSWLISGMSGMIESNDTFNVQLLNLKFNPGLKSQ